MPCEPGMLCLRVGRLILEAVGQPRSCAARLTDTGYDAPALVTYSDDEGRYVDALATVDLVLDQRDNRLNTASIADFDILE